MKGQAKELVNQARSPSDASPATGLQDAYDGRLTLTGFWRVARHHDPLRPAAFAS